MTDYHIPVMLNECIDFLNIQQDGNYLDATFGAGGHSKPILKKLNAKGHLYVFDRDDDVYQNIEDHESLTFCHADYRYISNFMKYYGIDQLDGILADLGISSHQIDVAERGFSFRFNAELDMRMNAQQTLTAKDIINQYSEQDLVQVFGEYGEVRNAKTLAKLIVDKRRVKSITTSDDLNALLSTCLMGQNQSKYFAQVYQALRIEVNDELNSLKEFLIQAKDLLKPGGRLVVLTYHSLEDRLVKNLMKTGDIDGKVIQDNFGKIYKPFNFLTKNPLSASDEELKSNPRSRSAKLRVAEKV